MLKKTVRFIIFVFSISVVFTGSAKALEVGVEGDYWLSKLTGDMRSDLGAIQGSTIELKEDIDMESENTASGKVYFEAGKHRLDIGYTPLSFEGSHVLTKQLVFHGQTYTVGTKADSKLKINQLDVQYTYWLLNLKTGARARLGLVGAVKNIDASASLKADPLGIDETQSITLPIPMIGLRAETGIGKLVRLTASGVGVAYSGNSIIDLTAALEVSPVPLFGIAAGFRGMYLTVDNDDTKIKASVSGAFIGIFARF